MERADRAKLVSAVVFGDGAKSGVSLITNVQAAAAAVGTEARWLGETPEEKAAILSWAEVEKSDTKTLLADVEKVLEKSSFVGAPGRETAADLILYSYLCNQSFGDDFSKANPNTTRWLNHMQRFVARSTANPTFHKFRIAGLRVLSQGSESHPPQESSKKEAKDSEPKNVEAKPQEQSKAAPSEAPKKKDPVAGVAASSEEPKKKESKKKETAPEGSAAKEEEEPKKKKPSMEKKEPLSEFLPLLLDVRVGKILSAKKHDSADSLFVEEIDVGEESPRTICSGLVKFYSSADMIVGKHVLVICNLKPRTMVGVESNGMVLAASNSDKSSVSLVEVPEGSKPGDRVVYSDAPPPPPEITPPNQVNKKKILESVMPGWGTDAEGRVMWKDQEKGTSHMMLAGDKPCSSSIKNGTVG